MKPTHCRFLSALDAMCALPLASHLRHIWFIASLLLLFTVVAARAIPPVFLPQNQEDGSGMYIADTIHLFAPGTDPALVQGSPPDDDNKIPLLLIHGIMRESVPGPSLQDGWHNFIAFFNATPALKSAYKPYIVAYKSNVVSVDQLGADFGILLDKLDPLSHGLQNKKFVILAHSMGGLISRAMMNKAQISNGVNWGERVIKLITLATPHHGTPAADNPGPLGPLGCALGVNIGLAAAADLYDFWAFPVAYDALNRSDLRWDNYDPNLQSSECWAAFPSQNNLWLQTFNSLLNIGRVYDNRIIAYAGYINSNFGHPLAYQAMERVITTAIGLSNDGAVPLESAIFHQHAVDLTRIKTDYDHTEMWEGKISGEPSTGGLFADIRSDLTSIAAKLPAAFSITASSQSANGASFVQINTTAQPLAGETYTLFRNGQPYQVFGGLTFQNSQVTPGATYTYYVEAKNAIGTTNSNSVQVTVASPTPTVPAAPSDLLATAVSPTQINLSWVNHSNIATGIIIERKTTGNAYAPILGSPFPASTTAHFDNVGLSPGTLYFYRVIAAASANSPPSGEVSTYTQSVISTARVLTVTSLNPGSGVHIMISPNDTNGLADGDTSFSRQYANSTSASLFAPATCNGAVFVKWQKDGQDWSVSTATNILMDASHTMRAVYATPVATGYTISTTRAPLTGGSTTGDGTYASGANVTITATPALGYQFLNWTLNTSGQNGGTTFAVQPQVSFQATSNLTLVANFTYNVGSYWNVTTAAEPPAGGTASGAGTYAASSNVPLSAQPAGGYVFDYWTENGTIISYIQSYQYPQISKSHDFVAHFHIPASGSAPDLFPKFILPQTTVFAGGTANRTVAILNQGTLSSNPFWFDFRISESNTVLPAYGNLDFYAQRNSVGGSIPPGVEAGGSGSFTLPSNLPPGTYYMWMVVDPELASGEPTGNRSNNITWQPFTVPPSPPANGPDLVPHDFAVTPAAVLVGGAINVSGGIRNTGNAASAAFKYYISISTSPTIAPDKSTLNTFGNVPALGIYSDAGASSGLTLPGTFTAGNYYLWIMTDPENTGGEPAGNRGNNNIVLPLTITQPAPTYAITASSALPAGGSVAGDGSYVEGALVPLVASPSAGYRLTNWTENGSVVSSSTNYSFTANSNRALVAGFVALTQQETWRQTWFGSFANSGDGADLSDYDKDGIPNLAEFAFGLNPTLNSAGQLPSGQKIGTNVVISFTQPAGVSGITYGAEWSTTLTGTWNSISDTGTAPQHTFSVPIGTNTHLFVRLMVTSP